MGIFVSFVWVGSGSSGHGSASLAREGIFNYDDVKEVQAELVADDPEYSGVSITSWQHFDTPASDVANDGYTDHDGDLAKAPLGYKIVDVVFATGGVASGLAEYFVWEYMDDGADIVRWRYAE